MSAALATQPIPPASISVCNRYAARLITYRELGYRHLDCSRSEPADLARLYATGATPRATNTTDLPVQGCC